MADLFPKAMLAAYNAHGSMQIGDEIRPEHLYRYKLEVGGDVVVDDEWALWEYLADSTVGWRTYDLTVADAIEKIGLDLLYVGGGSGRFAKACAGWGLNCHSIDSAPDAIELMRLRGVSKDLMDGNAMAFNDSDYPLVVIAPAAFDGSDDPTALLAEVARVASDAVLVSGWTRNPVTGETVTYKETITYQGEEEMRNATSYHWTTVEDMLVSAGMSVAKTVTFLASADSSEVSWLIEARH